MRTFLQFIESKDDDFESFSLFFNLPFKKEELSTIKISSLTPEKVVEMKEKVESWNKFEEIKNQDEAKANEILKKIMNPKTSLREIFNIFYADSDTNL